MTHIDQEANQSVPTTFSSLVARLPVAYREGARPNMAKLECAGSLPVYAPDASLALRLADLGRCPACRNRCPSDLVAKVTPRCKIYSAPAPSTCGKERVSQDGDGSHVRRGGKPFGRSADRCRLFASRRRRWGHARFRLGYRWYARRTLDKSRRVRRVGRRASRGPLQMGA